MLPDDEVLVSRIPEIWQHDVYYADGKPYSQAEIEFIKCIEGEL
jgi:hypothetical protein